MKIIIAGRWRSIIHEEPLKSAFEKLNYLINVQEIFKSFNGPNIRFIESVGSVSEVHEKVLTEIDDLFDFK